MAAGSSRSPSATEEAGGRLEVPARAELVSLVRLLVSSLASRHRDLSDDRVDDLKLAVSEACTNAIESYDVGAPSPRVAVSWRETDDYLEVCVRDRGRGFSPAELNGSRLGAAGSLPMGERGLGISLMRALVDEVSFTSDHRGTAVRMTLRCGRAMERAPSDSASG